MKRPKLSSAIYLPINHAINDRVVGIYRAINQSNTSQVIGHIERDLYGVFNQWKQGCLISITDTIRTP